jgi:uncharacterized protein
MSDSTNVLRIRVQENMKAAMRNRDTHKLSIIRLLLSAIKQREIDERITLDDSQILATIDKMIKQRLDSIEYYKKGSRQDLVDQETYEIEILKAYLPQQLSEFEVDQLIAEAFTNTQASSIKDMAKVMRYIKPKAQGRADMTKISALIKERLI